MANVLQPNIGFHPRPVSHSSSQLGFGFGLNSPGPSSMSMSAATSWGAAQPGHTNPAAFHRLASSIAQPASTSKSNKRRLEVDDEAENMRNPIVRDHSMDRSPTPERPKRAAPKRAKTTGSHIPHSKEDLKEKKAAETDDHDVDIGVLLASLPAQSLLPILMGLLKTNPALKSQILPLIPRPTFEDANEALKQAAKKLQDAIPFSNPPSLHHSFGAPHLPVMRTEYVLGRLRPHVAEFVSACMSYFPYFSYRYPSPSAHTKASNAQSSNPQSNSMQKDKFYPAESFSFLFLVTKLVIDQPSLVQSELEPLILPRLQEEWKLWLENLDSHVNRESQLVASSLIQFWENNMDKLADGKAAGISNLMKDVRRHFPLKQSWGLPQRTYSMMVEA